MPIPEMPKGYRPIISRILGRMGAAFIALLLPTYRWRRVLEVPPEIAVAEPVAFVFWHNQQLLMTKLYWKMQRDIASKGVVALASGHRDGQIIAQIVELFGFRTMSGSSSKGGLASLMALGRCLKAGYDVAMAPDGPKGPPGEVKQGILALAKKFNVPIIPLAYAVPENSAWRFNKAWDKMFLPKPFARISWAVGPALRFHKDHDLADAMQTLQTTINNLDAVVKADVVR